METVAAVRRAGKAGQDGLEFLPKVLVHPRVEDGVVAGGADRHDVGEKEDEHKIVPVGDGFRKVVVEDVDEIQRKPAAAENDDHRDKHAVGAAFPKDGRGFTASLTAGQTWRKDSQRFFTSNVVFFYQFYVQTRTWKCLFFVTVTTLWYYMGSFTPEIPPSPYIRL